MKSAVPLRRLPLTGAQNTRDLGGYPCTGGTTRWGIFLRADSPHRLTGKDLTFLKDYGVRTAIDLRSDAERAQRPSALTTAAGFTPHHVCMTDQMNANNFEGDLPGSMSGLYISLLDNAGADIASVFRILATAQGGTLFHCAVGKDRTGVIAMLLLGLAGVSTEDIVADYSITEIYMREIFDEQLKTFQGYEIPAHVLRSLPESMTRVLDHLQENHHSAEAYLLKAGLSEQDLAAIREKFIVR